MVYHVKNGDVEKLKCSSRMKTDGTYDVSFTTRNFSPFIFTTADIGKHAVATTSNEVVSVSYMVMGDGEGKVTVVHETRRTG